MNLKKKGTGISEVLVCVFIIIYIMLPLFCSTVHKAMFYHQAVKIEQAVEMAVISLINENSTQIFSLGFLELQADEQQLTYLISDEISKSCISSLRVNDDDIYISVIETGNRCSCGIYSEHFMISADITATLDFLGQRQFEVHKHIEFPVIR